MSCSSSYSVLFVPFKIDVHLCWFLIFSFPFLFKIHFNSKYLKKYIINYQLKLFSRSLFCHTNPLRFSKKNIVSKSCLLYNCILNWKKVWHVCLNFNYNSIFLFFNAEHRYERPRPSFFTSLSKTCPTSSDFLYLEKNLKS